MTDTNFYKSLGLPPIDQIGFVVRDLNAWIERYDALFGPFSLMDGSVNAADLTVWRNQYGLAAASVAAASAVPEPAGAALGAMAALTMLRRRRTSLD